MSHDELTVITVATKPDDHFKVLMQSCERHSIDITVLGMGVEWLGFCTKTNLVYRYLPEVRSPYTLFVDGFDSIFQSGVPEILETFQRFNHPLVICGERYCKPDESLRDQYPPVSTMGRFLNAGGYIGETKAVLRLLGLIGCPFEDEAQSEQRHFTRYFLAHLDEMRIDHYSEIFRALCGVEDFVEFRAGDQVYVNRGSGVRPHILHLNGTASRDHSYAQNLGYTL